MNGRAPLRIVHVFRAPVGGLFRHVTDLATEQTGQGHEVGIVCDASTGGAHEDEILERLRATVKLGVTRIAMPRQASPLDLAAAWRVRRAVGALAPDVIHGHGAKGGVYGRLAGALGGSKCVVRVYTPHGGSLHYDSASAIGRLYFAAERGLEHITDLIVHVCNFEAELYRTKVREPRCTVRVIPNGLAAAEFEPVVPRPDASDILFLGAFREIKGIDTLLEAIARLKSDNHLSVTAVLVGQPDGRARYQELAARLGIAAQLSFHDPMPARAAFAMARAVVMPSRAEALPYVVLEAIAAHLPTIATNVGGIPEIFGPYAGDLVPVGDAGALANAIRRAVSDPARARKRADLLHGWVRPRFNIAAMERAITGAYQEVADRRVLAAQ
jgi:glycosyltransferase involved in cell wall biosynthesis